MRAKNTASKRKPLCPSRQSGFALFPPLLYRLEQRVIAVQILIAEQGTAVDVLNTGGEIQLAANFAAAVVCPDVAVLAVADFIGGEIRAQLDIRAADLMTPPVGERLETAAVSPICQ